MIGSFHLDKVSFTIQSALDYRWRFAHAARITLIFGFGLISRNSIDRSLEGAYSMTVVGSFHSGPE